VTDRREVLNPAPGVADASGPGLTDDELEAEGVVELPGREAMSIVGLPGIPLGGADVDVAPAIEPETGDSITPTE
jgi:hypothetical protein